ncbi:MAG TPA: sulfatase-like hydrolase/transferase [Gemmatimonadaceae bacterium]
MLGVWLGLLYGYIEGVEIVVLGLVPGALAWRTGNSPDLLWFGPPFYGVVGLVLSLPFAAAASLGMRRGIERAMVFLYLLGGAWLAGSIAGNVIAPWAIAAVALGIAVQGTRLFERRVSPRPWLVSRGVLVFLAGIPVVWLMIAVGSAVRERLALRTPGASGGTLPNVLLLVLDTQRADHLSSYGYQRPTTPRIDALAAEGVLYEHAFSSSSWTLPSHASLMTGRYPQEHRAGVIRRPWLDDRYPTLAEVLRDRGYATGGFVANGYWCGRQTRLNRGFIRYEDFYHNLGDAVARTSLGRTMTYRFGPKIGLIDIPGRKRVGDVNAQVLDWLSTVEGRPFFAFLNYFDVHGPLLPPAPFAGRFSGVQQPRVADEIQIGAIQGDIPEYSREAIDAMIDAYDESLLSLDAGIGALIDSLRARGLLDNTIVIITSDHGESFGEHGMMFHGHSMFRDQTAVPLILRYPERVAAGQRLGAPVGIEQVPATVMRLASLSDHPFLGPALPLSASDIDTTHVVIGGVARRSLVAANWPSSRGWASSMVTNRYYFILHEDSTAYLFDLADQEERTDLSAMPEHAATVAAFRRSAADLWTRAARPAPVTSSRDTSRLSNVARGTLR